MPIIYYSTNTESGPRRPEPLASGSVAPRCLLCPRRAQVGIESDAGRFELACYRCVQILKLWWFGEPFRSAPVVAGHGYLTRCRLGTKRHLFCCFSDKQTITNTEIAPPPTPNPADSLQAPRSARRAG